MNGSYISIEELSDGSYRLTTKSGRVIHKSSDEWKKQKQGATIAKKYKDIETLEITHEGQTHTIKEWAAIKKLKPWTLYNRLFQRGWDMTTALNTPVNRGNKKKVASSNYKKIKVKDRNTQEYLTLREWSDKLVINYNTLYSRYRQNPEDFQYIIEALNKANPKKVNLLESLRNLKLPSKVITPKEDVLDNELYLQLTPVKFTFTKEKYLDYWKVMFPGTDTVLVPDIWQGKNGLYYCDSQWVGEHDTRSEVARRVLAWIDSKGQHYHRRKKIDIVALINYFK